MSTITIGFIGIAIVVALLMLRVPVAIAMGAVGFIGYWLISGIEPTLKLMGMVPFSTVANYTFTVIPLFILMGYFVYYGQLATDMFSSINKWFDRVHGGICYATIVGGAAFGAANGSGPASTATLAKITVPEMERLGVNRRLAYGIVASAGPLAQMIPPSMLMIIYAILAEQSVGKLLIAGIVPGIIIAIGYIVTVFILLKRNPSWAVKSERYTLKEKVKSLKGIWGIAILIGAIMVGLYLGYFTPTEAGAIGALLALIITIFSKKLTFDGFKKSVLESIKTTATVFLIVVSSFLFGYFLGISQIPNAVSTFLTGLDVPPMIIMFGICLLYIFLGMFIDMLSAMFLTIPIILPAVIDLGFDPIWFGVIVVFLAEISLVTPPFGLSIFMIQGAVKGSKYSEILKGSIPFIIADFVILLIFLFFPEIILFLPSLM
ncbi:TRAP transporter large permease [Ureibacillus massiliensis]|uniref:TRAP transporter large permease n=1 Tax=Ureibacillus massiliensis TaxID=292806 RepID=UPI000A00E0D8|nr:TRAP transporter large permease [Ureibacillus massiliensis]